jgi:hypothetical protein
MTFEDFMIKFNELAPKFRWTKGSIVGCLRTYNERWCPMQVVYKDLNEIDSANCAGLKLELSSHDISRIICAADNLDNSPNYDPQLREYFLKVTNQKD